MNKFDSDQQGFLKLIRQYLRPSSLSENNGAERKVGRRAVAKNTMQGVLGLTMTAGSSAWIAHFAYDHYYNEVQIIYNNDPVLESLKKAMHGELSRLTTKSNDVPIPSPLSSAIAYKNLTDDIIIAVRSDTKVFPGGFHGVHRHIDVVVSTSFLQSCPVEVLADNFIRMLKIKLMQPLTERDEILRSPALIRIP